MDQVSQTPENALFEINHIEHTASSNTFTVEKAYEITLQGTSPDPDTVTEIGIKDDMESLRENVHSLADSYNEYIGRIAQPQTAHTRSSQLSSEFPWSFLALRTGAFFPSVFLLRQMALCR